MSRVVYHKPVWVPGPLRINESGYTRPGFWCAHPLENGNGLCGGNVFAVEDEISDHSCVVVDSGGCGTEVMGDYGLGGK